MWIERGARVGLIAASHFIEIKVFPLSLFPPILRSMGRLLYYHKL